MHNNNNMKRDPLTKFSVLPVVGLILLNSFSLGSAGSVKTENADDPLTQFKQFIASPPVIDRIVYRTITTSNPSQGLPPSEGTMSVKDQLVYLVARCQPDCLFVKSGTNLNVVLPGRQRMEEIDAKYHNEYW